MPDTEVLQEIYGQDYYNAADDVPDGELTDEIRRVAAWLQRANKPGTFIDYGCRKGVLLTEALKLGWRAIGIEINPDVAADTERRTGAQVVVPDDPLLNASLADILHLGDVIEHLTALDSQMPAILRLIKPGGLLIAQGPLEANSNLFTLVIRSVRRTRRSRPIEMAPAHVIPATSSGQRALFDRFGLRKLEYSLTEVDWPAPSQFSTAVGARDASLFIIRRLSQACSRLRPASWGNRYFYAGRTPMVISGLEKCRLPQSRH